MKPVAPVLISLEAKVASVADGPKYREVVYGANQPEYLPLPTLVGPSPQCEAITRWEPSWKERCKILIGGSIWLSQWTFGNPLQPVRLTALEPFSKDWERLPQVDARDRAIHVTGLPWIFSRWWVGVRPVGEKRADGTQLIEFYIPRWAKPLDWLHARIFGRPKIGGVDPDPINAKDAGDDEAVVCRGMIEGEPILAENEVMWMPAGLQTLTPSQGGKAINLQVFVDRSSAAAAELQRQAIVARGDKPYFDLNHDDAEASFWPDRFYWKGDQYPGVYASGEWTDVGTAARKGKRFRGFSPTFHVDDIKAKPARIVCFAKAAPNMGGLVNNQAFKNNLPLWAKDAGAPSDNPNQNQTEDMTKEERARLQSTITGLQNEIATLRGDASKATELRAKEAELRAAQAEIRAADAEEEATAVKAKNDQLTTADQTRRKTDAQAFVKGMVDRGAIAAKDTATQTSVETNMTENPEAFRSVYEKWPSNPAIAAKDRQTSSSAVAIVNESPNDKMKAYAAIVAANAKLPLSFETAKAKDKLAREAHAVFAKDLTGDTAVEAMSMEEAVQAADNADVSVGLLSGTLVLNRTLSELQYEFPIFSQISTDMSSAPGLLNQEENVQIIVKPAVQEYDASFDAGGRPKGWTTASPAQAVQVPIKLTKHYGVPIVFGVQTLASTLRNLFAEQASMALYALGEQAMGMLTGLMTPAHFNAYKGVSVAGGETTDGETTVVVASTANMFPAQAISGAGIPANTYVRSIIDETHAVLTQAATATASGLTFTLGAGKVPIVYPTYVRALADWSAADLGAIGAAFSTNEVPEQNRFVLQNPSYYHRLSQDPSLNSFFAAMQKPEIVTKGSLPEVQGFQPIKAPWFPSSNHRFGFAGQKPALLFKSRLPQDFASAVAGGAPGSVTTVTVPGGMSVLLVQYVNLQSNYAEWRPEVLLGANVGERRCGLVLTDE